MVSMPDFNHIGGGQVLSQLPHPVVVVKQSFVALLQRFFRVLRTPKSILSSWLFIRKSRLHALLDTWTIRDNA